jgi:hypothetical protein
MPVKLKPIIDHLADAPGSPRDAYVARSDGKWELQIDGDVPGYVKADKLAEFRENNRTLNAKLADAEAKLKAFDGIDPAEYQTLKARPDLTPRVTELEAALATERGAKTTAQQTADAAVFRAKVADSFLAAGGRPEALEFVVAKAREQFVLENGALSTKDFSPSRPGEPLSLAEWMGARILDSAFAFKPSSGGGASHSATPQPKRTIGSDPLEFGRNVEAIAKGQVTVS